MTAANWDVLPVANDDLVFPDNVTATSPSPNNDFPAGTHFHSITFSKVTSTAVNYSLTGNSVVLGAGGFTDNDVFVGANEQVLPIVLGANATFAVTAPDVAVVMTVSGAFTLTKTGASELYLGPPPGGSTPVHAIVTAGTLAVGGGSIGNVSVQTGGDFYLYGGTHTGTLTITGGQLDVSRQLTGFPINAYPGNVALASGSTLLVAPNVSSLSVTGTVSLGNATLASTTYTPVAGASFVIITNDGTDAVVGTFAGLPEGAPFMVGGKAMRVSYVGGDGNDVSLTTANLTTTAITSNASGGEIDLGDSVTFHATVTGAATVNGTVLFLDGPTVLGSATLASGAASYATTALTAGSHSITARYEGAGTDAGSSAMLTLDVIAPDMTDTIMDLSSSDLSGSESVDLSGASDDMTASSDDLGTGVKHHGGCDFAATPARGSAGFALILVACAYLLRRRARYAE